MLARAASKVEKHWTSDSRRWDSYRPRAGDIVIATAPKCGTTWMQQIVSLLIFQSAEPRSLRASPWIDCRFQAPLETMMAMVEGQDHRRFLKAHTPFDALPIYDEVHYIHVARDGRDACMSFHNHIHGMKPETLARFDAIGLGDPDIAAPFPRMPRDPRDFFIAWLGDEAPQTGNRGASYFDIERSFWKERMRSNLLMVHYNDLKADLAGEMKRIAAFLDIQTPDKVWPSLVDAATFATMKRDGGALLPGIETTFEGGHQTFLNRGTNDRWRDSLTAADIECYEARARAELSPALIGWLEAGRVAAGDPRAAPD